MPRIAADEDAPIFGLASNRFYERAFQLTPIGMSFVTLDRRAVHCNPALCRFLGRTVDELKAINIGSLTHPDDAHLHVEDHERLLRGEIDHYALDKRYIHKDGHVVWGHLEVAAVQDEDGARVMLLSQVMDISERVALSESLRWHATHDALTGFVNRVELFACLRRSIESLQDGHAFAVFYLDLDGFKAINDRHGHAAGDHALMEAATCISRTLRKSDTAARIGGDEFVLVVEDCRDRESAARLAQRIVLEIQKGVPLDGATVPLSASIGICLARDEAPEAILQRADAALYQAKRAGKGRYVMAD